MLCYVPLTIFHVIKSHTYISIHASIYRCSNGNLAAHCTRFIALLLFELLCSLTYKFAIGNALIAVIAAV